jgi:hypothetical protein
MSRALARISLAVRKHSVERHIAMSEKPAGSKPFTANQLQQTNYSKPITVNQLSKEK